MPRNALIALAAALLVLSAHHANAEIELSIGQPGPEDDYICWGRVPASVSAISGESPISAVTITAAPHETSDKGGRIGFAISRNPDEALQDTLVVSIDPTTRTGNFFVAGTSASVAKKDVRILAGVSGATDHAELPLMVRVRKNAETLSDDERDIFLQAFASAARRDNQFAKYWGVHTDAVRMAHQVAFLPWHRVFLVNLERELQRENPSVALPYWEFDRPAPKLFSTEFLGRVGNLANPQEVEFSASNPLVNFRLSDPRVAPLTRLRNADVEISPGINKDFFSETEHGLMTSEIFGPYHGAAHVFIGGLVGDISRSPVDPLFFLLHANVDRAWAAWQHRHDRFQKSDASAYALQGAHTPKSEFVLGNYADDTMWPWDHITRPTEPVTITIGQVELPPKVGAGEDLSASPRVGETLDYLDLIGDGAVHNYCYDMIPALIGPVAGFP